MENENLAREKSILHSKILKKWDSFLTKKKEGMSITYKLTSKGEESLKQAKRRFARTFLGLFP
jgi:predicted transcriptional regulator